MYASNTSMYKHTSMYKSNPYSHATRARHWNRLQTNISARLIIHIHGRFSLSLSVRTPLSYLLLKNLEFCFSCRLFIISQNQISIIFRHDNCKSVYQDSHYSSIPVKHEVFRTCFTTLFTIPPRVPGVLI